MRIVLVFFLMCVLSVVALGQETETDWQTFEYGVLEKATLYKLVTTPYGMRLVESDSMYYLYFPSNWDSITVKLVNDGTLQKGRRLIATGYDENAVLHTYLVSWQMNENGKVRKYDMPYIFPGSRFGHRKIIWFKYPIAVFPHHNK